MPVQQALSIIEDGVILFVPGLFSLLEQERECSGGVVMFAYILRRLLYTIPVLWGVVTVVFILMAVVPGDPARLMMGQRGDPQTLAKIRADLGLDLPLHQQYLRFLKDVARGDFW